MPGEIKTRWRLRGRVQGIGFRPVVFRLAHELGLHGWVRNDPSGAEVVLRGIPDQIARFRAELPGRLPAAAAIDSIEEEPPPDDVPARFDILPSAEGSGARVAGILPDLATCPECRRDIFDPRDRRYRYPFTNCTRCGPRFSIIRRLPYDRVHTTMAGFQMCPDCLAEYHDPGNRRFHAQPNACPRCGPALAWGDAGGAAAPRNEAALQRALTALKSGQIVAVKGIGGFHLMVDARNNEAVRRLRLRKQREEKPLAVLFPDVNAVLARCDASADDVAWLQSAAAPIVLLNRKPGADDLAEEIAPGLPWIGALLPYSPLHHLLMAGLGFPIVATSGNRSDEPICTDNAEAFQRLKDIADGFLWHDRPIARPMDDSVIATGAGAPLMIRRGRGLAPYSQPLPGVADGGLAVGAQLKNTVAIGAGGQAVMGPHIGDLDHEAAVGLWTRTIQDLSALHGLKPSAVAADAHPLYTATQGAADMGLPVEIVQHHHAHIVSCMAEHGLPGPVLGVAWDGAGWGPDGTIWGGEFLICTRTAFQRVAWLRPFSLPGGDAAMREPRRSAFGLLREMGSAHPPPGFSDAERAVVDAMLETGINVVRTSSAGRLFDAVASLLDVCQVTAQEAIAAMRLEALAGAGHGKPYPFAFHDGVLDWAPMITAILSGRDDPRKAAGRFHATLSAMIVEVARHARIPDVCLSGGCFQNRLLLREALSGLERAGFRTWRQTAVPPNDAGICLGQLAVMTARHLSAADTAGELDAESP